MEGGQQTVQGMLSIEPLAFQLFNSSGEVEHWKQLIGACSYESGPPSKRMRLVKKVGATGISVIAMCSSTGIAHIAEQELTRLATTSNTQMIRSCRLEHSHRLFLVA
mmetsp:Transcript_21090/g.25332  ORF Transcript_21090/g.25332 Transcript_21090/m.25332 type:complete len:107 (-) Transcript_21090:4770-5090(-)